MSTNVADLGRYAPFDLCYRNVSINICNISVLQAYVGDTHVSELVKFPLTVASLHVHPGYKNNDQRPNYDNDIALIKLNSSITFNSHVMPVCLPPHGADLKNIG